MKVVGITLVILLGATAIGLELLFSHFQKAEFTSPIDIAVKVENSLYTGNVKLESGVKYALVTSGIFDSAFDTEYAKAPKLTLDGEYMLLEGGKSNIDKNLVLDWHWVKKSKTEYEKRYYGSFTTNSSCDCVIQLDGLKPSFLKDYKVSLYKDVSESYFIYGWLVSKSIYLVIFFGFLYLTIDSLKGVKAFFLKKRAWLLGKF